MKRNFSSIFAGVIWAGFLAFSSSIQAQKGATLLMDLKRPLPADFSAVDVERTLPAVTANAQLGLIKTKRVLDVARKCFPNYKGLGDLELLQVINSNPSMIGNLRGSLAEEDFFARDSSWTRVRSKNAPQNDGWRWVNGIVGGRKEGVQVKVYSDWRKYIPEMMNKDTKAEYFAIPDDQYQQVFDKLDRNRLGNLRGGELEKAAAYAHEQQRLRKLGRTFDELECSIVAARQESELMTVGKTAMVLQSAKKIDKAGKALAGVGIIASAVQVYDGLEEVERGEKVKGGLNLAGGTAYATSTVAGLAGRRLLSGAAGAAGAGLDGAIDVYSGIKNKDSEKLSVGGVKSAGAIIMGIGVTQPELAPVLIPVGAITYGGAVVTDVVYENREPIRNSLNSTLWSIYDHTPDTIKNNGTFQKSVSWFHGF